MLTNEEILAIARETVSRLFKEKGLDGKVEEPCIEVETIPWGKYVHKLMAILTSKKSLKIGDIYVPSLDELIESIDNLGSNGIVIELEKRIKGKIVCKNSKLTFSGIGWDVISENCEDSSISSREVDARLVWIGYDTLHEPPPGTYVSVSDYVLTNKGFAPMNVALTLRSKNKIVFYGLSEKKYINIDKKHIDLDNIIHLDRKRVECTAIHEVAGHYLSGKGIILVEKCIDAFYRNIRISPLADRHEVYSDDERVAECIMGVLEPDCIDVREQLFKEDEKRPIYSYVPITQYLLDNLLQKFPGKVYYRDLTIYNDPVGLRKYKLNQYRIGIEAAKKIIEKG